LNEIKDRVSPHGGKLTDLIVEPGRRDELETASQNFVSLSLTPRQLCDLELLLNGGFSPLTGFMTRRDYESVCNDMRLGDGTLWPMPITLDVTDEFAKALQPDGSIALRDAEGFLLAILHVEEIWKADLLVEGNQFLGPPMQSIPRYHI
jgi:ATP sulfurylase (sulfate adenylyltransferase)